MMGKMIKTIYYVYSITFDGVEKIHRTTSRLDYRKTCANAKAEGHTIFIKFIESYTVNTGVYIRG